MTSALDEAERLVRDFARRTNLQIAGRPFRVTRSDAVGAALRELLPALGAREIGAYEAHARAPHTTDPHTTGPHPDTTPPGFLEFGHSVLLDGAPIPERGDAAGRVDFAGAHMATAHALAEQLATSGLARGLRVGVAMMLEPKTANLALLLRDAGAEVAVYAHPDETDAAVADALRARGVRVDADASLDRDGEREAALAWLTHGFDVVMDDGSHLVRLAHEAAPQLVERWIGVTEETTSGLRPLRAMQEAGVLATPVVAVNDAPTKTSFDNRYGTGQSCVFAIADVLEGVGITLRDQPALVIGYGPVGQGVAVHLRALGAHVRVAEQDAVRTLLAVHDGFEVGAAHLLAEGALVVSATGVRGTVTQSVLRIAKVVAVAGGVPGEVELAGTAFEPVAPHVERVGDTLVLDRGGCINITAAEGNPIEIMDLSFATQLVALQFLLRERPGVGVHELPAAYVADVAKAALRARGLPDGPATASGGDTDWRSARYR